MIGRNKRCVDVLITEATATESAAAKTLLARQRRKRICPATLPANKGYHSKDCVAWLRRQRIAPYIARIDGRRTPGLGARTTRHESYRVSQYKRKRVEEIFGWVKCIGGLRKSRFIGQAKTQMAAYLTAAA